MARELDVGILRQAITKLTQMLADKGIKVTQRGAQAYVKSDRRGNILSINLPHLPDNATQDVIAALHGFLDHEVGHVLFTNFKVVATANKISKKMGNLHNIVEDVFVEAQMRKRFPGSSFNLEQVHDFFLKKMSKPALDKATTPNEIMSVMIVPIARALGGQQAMIRFVKENPSAEVDRLMKALTPFSKRLTNLKDSEECLEIAKEISDLLTVKLPPPPPMPPMPPMPPSKKAGEEGDSESGDEGDEGKGKSDDEGEDDDKPDAPAPGKNEGDDTDEGDEGDDTPASLGSSDDEGDEGDEDGADEDGAGEGEEGGSSGSSDENQDDEDDDGEEGGSSGSSDEGDEGEEGDKDDEGDEQGSSGEGGEDQDDGDDFVGGAGSRVEDEGDEGDEDDGAEDDGDKDGSSDEDDSAADDEQPPEAPGSGTNGSPEEGKFFIPAEVFEEIKDFDDAVAAGMTEETAAAMREAEYVVFTTDDDRIEIYEPKVVYPNAVIDLDEKTRQMVGVMQKDIERLVAARSRSVWQPGLRSGRLHSAALSRVKTGDDRVFRRKVEHKSKDTAVTVLLDNSGSMQGSKLDTACIAGYALASTLERINVKCEVLGFTTAFTDYHNSGALAAQREVNAEASRLGVRFSRWEPLYMPIYKTFSERMTPQVKQRLANVYLGSNPSFLANNVDGESIAVAARRLAARPESRKVMFVLSDGYPSADGHGLNAHLKSTVADLEKSGMYIVAIGIKSEAVASFYKRSVVLHDIAELPARIMKELRQLL